MSWQLLSTNLLMIEVNNLLSIHVYLVVVSNMALVFFYYSRTSSPLNEIESSTTAKTHLSSLSDDLASSDSNLDSEKNT